MTNLVLKEAPAGFIPNCNTRHLEAEGIILQEFKGGKVTLELYKTDSHCEAVVEGRTVGRFTDVTIRDWSNILYTLQTEFANQIDA